MTNKPLRTLLSAALALALLLLPAALADSGAFPESAVVQIGRPEALGSLLPGWHSYASSCSAIVSVDESGTLFAHHSGSAVVTAENASGQTASCAVTVDPPVFYARIPALADELLPFEVLEQPLTDGEIADAPYAVDAFNLSGEEQACLYAFSAPEEGWYDALASGAVCGLNAYLWDAEDYLTLESLPVDDQTQDRTLRVFLKQNATLFFCLTAAPDETGYSLSVCPSPETEDPAAVQTPAQKITEAPTQTITKAPTQKPTQTITKAPTQKPTDAPTQKPTQEVTATPTQKPTQTPTQTPTQKPTQTPTQAPTQTPTQAPTQTPTQAPTQTPTPEPTDFNPPLPDVNPDEGLTNEPTSIPTPPPNAGGTQADDDELS